MNGGQNEYKVSPIGGLDFVLHDLWEQALARRCSLRFAESVRSAMERMARDPHAWGDFLFSMADGKIKYYRGICDVIVCHYGIDESHHEVYLASVAANPSTPLGDQGYSFP